MPSKLTQSSKKQQKIVWSVSLFLGWGLAFFLAAKLLPLAYGSFLLWALAAGFIWDRKAPFLTVGIFLVGSASLSWEVLSQEPGRWFSSETVLWTLLVFLSSFCSSLGLRLQYANGRVIDLEQGYLLATRWSILGRMTVSMGHELRNQIAIVIGYLEQMKEDEQLPPAYRRKIERSLLANHRMLKILTQLRFMTRDCTNEPLQPLTLGNLVQEALEFLERPLEYRALSVSWKAEPELPQVIAHPVLLQTLLVHLILHSLERFKAQTTAKEKTIGIDMRRHGEGICLHYQDNCEDPSLWGETDQTLAQQLILRLGGLMEQKASLQSGWEVSLYLKAAPPSAADQNQEALVAS